MSCPVLAIALVLVSQDVGSLLHRFCQLFLSSSRNVATSICSTCRPACQDAYQNKEGMTVTVTTTTSPGPIK